MLKSAVSVEEKPAAVNRHLKWNSGILTPPEGVNNLCETTPAPGTELHFCP